MRRGCGKIEDRILDYIRGELAQADEDRVRTHLAACPDCKQAVQETVTLLDTLKHGTRMQARPDFTARVLAAAKEQAADSSSRLKALIAKPQKNLPEHAAVFKAFFNHRLRNAPVWVAAVAVHAAAVLLLTVLYIPYQIAQQPPVVLTSTPWIDRGIDKSIEDNGTEGPTIHKGSGMPGMPDVSDPEFKDIQEKHTPRRTPGYGSAGFPSRGTTFGTQQIIRQSGMVAGWFGKRGNPGRKGKALEDHGGEKTAPLLRRSLEFLARSQDKDGGFSTGTRKGGNYRVGVTGLVLLAFLGDGNARSRGTYHTEVNRGVEFLLNLQNPATGLIGPDRGHYMYNHGIASCALLECCGMERQLKVSRNKALRRAARAAVQFILSAQNESGAFAYTRKGTKGDTSVTAWQVMALELAWGLRFHLNLDSRTLRPAWERTRTWFEKVTSEKGFVGYQGLGSVKTYPESMTATGLFCTLSLPARKGDSALHKRQGQLLLERSPGRKGLPDFYFWYYATTALFRAEHSGFPAWNQRLIPRLQSLQMPDGGFPSRTAYGDTGGRVYTTALASLIMEVYYRLG